MVEHVGNAARNKDITSYPREKGGACTPLSQGLARLLGALRNRSEKHPPPHADVGSPPREHKAATERGEYLKGYLSASPELKSSRSRAWSVLIILAY